ncbi:serine threonine protein kinase [Diplodia corticola]|uniref:Serine threonine protein kinase n=1 Tax=Diplodia corticola TaxID=236234 RepID=A0A1J9QZ41_9PEZI|nr:serine threonine protein kinase [Diplodia corticola]OJD33664.1 serine threonine protein kinase [Diplodia corticola]
MDPEVGLQDRRSRYQTLSSIGLYKPSDPLRLFSDVRNLLRESQIEGPVLVRLSREFSTDLGEGRTCRISAVSGALRDLTHDESARQTEHLQKGLENLSKIAVKKAQLDTPLSQSRESSAGSHTSTIGFGKQLHYIRQEIVVLSHPRVRHHPNIVKLIGWALDLDALETFNPKDYREPIIPLLLLERAEFDFETFIKRSKHDPNRFDMYRHLCLDVGRGLHALHRADIIHGDMKLRNILVSKQHDKWTAKICDFSHSSLKMAVGDGDGEPTEYTGTKGWTPLPGSSRVIKGDMVSCDIFSYGLVVWCVFMERSDTFLADRRFQIREEDIYRKAKDDLTKKAKPNSNAYAQDQDMSLNRILNVLVSSVHHDPLLWEKHPWVYFDCDRFPSIDIIVDEPTLLMKLASSTSRLVDLWSHQWKTTTSRVRKVWELLTSVLHGFFSALSQGVLALFGLALVCILLIVRRITIRSMSRTKSERQIACEKLCAELSSSLGIRRINAEELDILNHPSGRHYDLSPLLWNWTLARSDAQLYAIARLRSRFLPCCWDKVRLASALDTTNLVEGVFYRDLDSSITAWLCRGELGKSEIDGMTLARMPWVLRMTPRKASNLMILLEKGLRVDRIYAGSTETILYSILHSIGSSEDEQLPTLFEILLGRSREDESFKWFMTGQGLGDRFGESTSSDDSGFQTTALHESVKAGCHVAVGILIQAGFNTRAMDSENKTAYARALEIRRRTINEDARSLSLENDKIIGLLDKFEQDQREDDAEFEVPAGWDVFDLPHPDRRVYRDRHFNSLTLQTPCFSFFRNRRLALGFGELIYHLDLLSFLPQNQYRTKQYAHRYTEQWYRDDIKDTRLKLRAVLEPVKQQPHYRRLRRNAFHFSSVEGLLGESTHLLNPPPPFHQASPSRQADLTTPTVLFYLQYSILGARSFERGFYLTGKAYSDILLLAIPFALATQPAGWSPWIGTCCALASLIPLCGLFSVSVSRLRHFGDHMGNMAVGTTSLVELFLLGMLWIAHGIQHRQSWLFEVPTTIQVSLTFVGSLITILPSTIRMAGGFYNTLDIAVTVTRGAGVFGICISLLAHYFELHSHADFYVSEEPDEDDGANLEPGLRVAFASALLSGIATAFCSNALLQNLVHLPTGAMAPLTLFCVPIIPRLSTTLSLLSQSYSGQSAQASHSALAANSHMLLVVVPMLNLLSWAMEWDATIIFNTFQVTIIFVVTWVISVATQERRADYLRGSVLIALYHVSSLTYFLYSSREV